MFWNSWNICLSVKYIDSMVGYKMKNMKDLVKFSARVDDVLNFIPSRITAILIQLFTIFIKKLFEFKIWKNMKV